SGGAAAGASCVSPRCSSFLLGTTPRETNFVSQTADRPRTWESSFPTHGVAPPDPGHAPRPGPATMAGGRALPLEWLASPRTNTGSGCRCLGGTPGVFDGRGYQTPSPAS